MVIFKNKKEIRDGLLSQNTNLWSCVNRSNNYLTRGFASGCCVIAIDKWSHNFFRKWRELLVKCNVGSSTLRGLEEDFWLSKRSLFSHFKPMLFRHLVVKIRNSERTLCHCGTVQINISLACFCGMRDDVHFCITWTITWYFHLRSRLWSTLALVC